MKSTFYRVFEKRAKSIGVFHLGYGMSSKDIYTVEWKVLAASRVVENIL